MPREFQLTTLDNGLRVVTQPMAGIKTVAVGTWIGVGTRYEPKGKHGISHFLEHMALRGTVTRDELQLVRAIESRGGVIDANTTMESTYFQTRVPHKNLAYVFRTIADMICNATMMPDKIIKEGLAIGQELKGYNDTPYERSYSLMMEQAFPKNGLGRPYWGSISDINKLSRHDLSNFLVRHYTPDRMVVAASGQVNHKELVDLAQESYGNLNPAPRAITARKALYVGGGAREEYELSQIQLCLGFKGVSAAHPDAATQEVLAHFLGGGMSSPLYQHIRVRRGLSYDVDKYTESFRDTGIFTVIASLDGDRVTEYLDTLTGILLKRIPRMNERQLRDVKQAIHGQDDCQRESPNDHNLWVADSLLSLDKIPTAAERDAEVDAVTLDDVQRVYAEILSSTPTLAACGDISHLESYEDFAERFADCRPKKKRNRTTNIGPR